MSNQFKLDEEQKIIDAWRKEHQGTIQRTLNSYTHTLEAKINRILDEEVRKTVIQMLGFHTSTHGLTLGGVPASPIKLLIAQLLEEELPLYLKSDVMRTAIQSVLTDEAVKRAVVDHLRGRTFRHEALKDVEKSFVELSNTYLDQVANRLRDSLT